MKESAHSCMHNSQQHKLSESPQSNTRSAGKKGMSLTDNRGLENPVQRKANNTGLPDNLKSGIENLSGHSMDDVKVHYNSSAPAQLSAHAYAQGTNIHIAPGQEKHLPHEAWHVVQQKQGRVRPTTQLKGQHVNDNSSLEKEADVMGEQATESGTEERTFESGRHPLQMVKVNQSVIQGAFGLEKESKVAVVQDGEPVLGYPKIGENDLFKVDLDMSKGKSILEVVTKHFNEHAGPVDAALAHLAAQFGAAWGFITAAQSVAADTPLAGIAAAHNLALGAPYQELVVKPGGTLAGPVHFTVGFGLETIPQLFQHLVGLIAGKTSTGSKSARKRVGEAAGVGRFSGGVAEGERNKEISPLKIDGFMQLLYSQVGAILDGGKNEEPGLIKNRTVALSRVSMGTVFRTLNPAEQKLVASKKFYEAVLKEMQKTYSGVSGVWGSHKNDATLFAPLARTMLKAAFQADGVADNDPSVPFGKMTLVANSEQVGDPADPQHGFALELRKIPVADESSYDSIMHAAQELILLSRGLHRTPEQLPAKPADKPAAAMEARAPEDDVVMRKVLSAMNFVGSGSQKKSQAVDVDTSSEAEAAIREIVKDSSMKEKANIGEVLAAYHAVKGSTDREEVYAGILHSLPPGGERLAEEIVGYITGT